MTARQRLVATAATRGAWLLRWLLVLLIAFDQIGSPLHRHHHDSGVDAVHLSQLGSHGTAVASLSVRERDGHSQTIFHSNTAVRSEARGLGSADAQVVTLGLFVAVAWPELSIAAPAPRSVGLQRAEPAVAPHASWHELLPEGRAPPLRA